MGRRRLKMSQINVGDGATFYVGSDRYPYTVVGVLSPKRLQVRRDFAKRIDHNGAFSESQTWEYAPNDRAEVEVISLRKNGRWYNKGSSMRGGFFSIGTRSMYQDPHF